MPPLSRRQLLLAGAGFPLAAEAKPAPSWRQFALESRTLVVPGLHPLHRGLKVAQLSDVHVGDATPDSRILRAVADVRAAMPDLVVLTGDYVTTKRDPLERVPELLRDFGAPTFAVLGNHDHWSDAEHLRRGLTRNGFEVLQNAHSVLELKGAPLTVIGVDDGVSKHADVTRALDGVRAEGSRLVLTHTPNTASLLPQGLGAVFAGHTHGGQLYFPGLTPALWKVAGMPFVRGHYQVRGNSLYVNRGLGFGRDIRYARMNSEPEVTLFTLEAARPPPVGRINPGELRARKVHSL